MTQEVKVAADGQPQEGAHKTEAQETKGQEPSPASSTEGSSQEGKTFGEDTVKALRSEAAAYRTRAKEAESKVAEYEESSKSEVEKLSGKVTRAEQRAAEAEAKLLRFTVAIEKQVDPELVPLLSATSREELEQQANLLVSKTAQVARPANGEYDGGAKPQNDEPVSPEQAHQELLVNTLFGRPQT